MFPTVDQISDQFFEKLRTDLMVPGRGEQLSKKLLSLSQPTAEEIENIASIMQKTWEGFASNLAMYLGNNWNGKQLVSYYNNKNTFVGFASYNIRAGERRITVQEFGAEREFTHSVVSALAHHFQYLLQQFLCKEVIIPHQIEPRSSRASVCRNGIGHQQKNIAKSMAEAQGLSAARSIGQYTVGNPDRNDFTDIRDLYNHIWEEPLDDFSLFETGQDRRHHCVVVRNERKSVVAAAVFRFDQEAFQTCVPHFVVDPYEAPALPLLAGKLEEVNKKAFLQGLLIPKQEAVGRKQREEFDVMFSHVKTFKTRFKARADSIDFLQKYLRQNVEKCSITSMFGEKIRKMILLLLMIPIDGETARDVLDRRIDRFVDAVDSIISMATNSGQNLFLPQSRFSYDEGNVNRIKQPTREHIETSVNASFRHMVHVPEGSQMVVVRHEKSTTAAAVFTPPIPSKGQRFALHTFLPYSDNGQERGGGILLACELLKIISESPPLRQKNGTYTRDADHSTYLRGYPMAAPGNKDFRYSWQSAKPLRPHYS